jgi:bacillithiol system protein YtxJ
MLRNLPLKQLEELDGRLLASIEASLREVSDKAGDQLVCKSGCTECCIGPFSITRLDAWRLRKGLRLLNSQAPDRVREIVERARRMVSLFSEDFPGDQIRGILNGDEELEDAFFERHAGLPCPVLDQETGLCLLYDSRPLSCRTFGPPVQFGCDKLPPCHLCFREAREEEMETCRLYPDPENIEGLIFEQTGTTKEEDWETIVAFALAAFEQKEERHSQGMIRLTSRQELEEALKDSFVVLFKHSPRCAVSRTALREMEEFAAGNPEIPVFVIDVVDSRELSRELAERTGVRHESPQVVIWREGAVVWHASHYRIRQEGLLAQVATALPES